MQERKGKERKEEKKTRQLTPRDKEPKESDWCVVVAAVVVFGGGRSVRFFSFLPPGYVHKQKQNKGRPPPPAFVSPSFGIPHTHAIIIIIIIVETTIIFLISPLLQTSHILTRSTKSALLSLSPLPLSFLSPCTSPKEEHEKNSKVHSCQFFFSVLVLLCVCALVPIIFSLLRLKRLMTTLSRSVPSTPPPAPHPLELPIISSLFFFFPTFSCNKTCAPQQHDKTSNQVRRRKKGRGRGGGDCAHTCTLQRQPAAADPHPNPTAERDKTARV
jgi:hypothetical protein